MADNNVIIQNDVFEQSGLDKQCKPRSDLLEEQSDQGL